MKQNFAVRLSGELEQLLESTCSSRTKIVSLGHEVHSSVRICGVFTHNRTATRFPSSTGKRQLGFLSLPGLRRLSRTEEDLVRVCSDI